MHATTTAAQAAEATPIRAAKAKRAALTAARPGGTPVQAAIRVAETYRREVMEVRSQAHAAAEERTSAAKRAVDAVPFPAELIVPKQRQLTDDPITWPTSLVFRHPDGREEVREITSDATERLNTRDAVIARFESSKAELEDGLVAFDRWAAEVAPLQAALEEAEAAEDAASEAFQQSYTKLDALCRAILRAPAEPHEAAAQVEAYARLITSCNGKHVKPSQITFNEDAAPMIEFMHKALRQVAAAPPPPAVGMADPALDYDLLSAIGQQMHLRERQEAATKAERVDEAEEHSVSMQPVLEQAFALRANTLAGLMGRVWLVEDWMPTVDSIDGDDLEWKAVRSLLDDIKGLYAAHEPHALVGSKAVTAGWIAAGAAQRCGVFPAHTMAAE